MDTFDYIVVGAGSAGCAVAARLSEDSTVSVAVVEAGSRTLSPQVQTDIATPWRWGFLQQSVVDWAYESVPQPHLNGRRLPEPRGRLPGGIVEPWGERRAYDEVSFYMPIQVPGTARR